MPTLDLSVERSDCLGVSSEFTVGDLAQLDQLETIATIDEDCAGNIYQLARHKLPSDIPPQKLGLFVVCHVCVLSV